MTKRFWLGILFCLKTFLCVSQIQITYPVSRIVFQRDNNNQAQISIAGNYFQNLDRIEARMVPVWGGSGNETSWNTIVNSPTTGFFNGQINVSGGWYNLEVRGVLNGNIVATSTLDRVGIGEVFIVAGQSNAQGDAVYSGGGTGTNDDRVSCIDYYENFLNEDNLPFQFSQLGNFKRIAPYNYVPWFWGRLGEMLVQRLNVPVLFYGAALGGIGSSAWRRSSGGEDLRRELSTFIAVPGMPYRAMKASLQHYATRTGVRAVLWQQGESDDATPQALYYDNIRTVIEKSRSDAQKGDLAWVIARSSANPTIHPNVINAQNQLTQSIHAVFTGPETDGINGPENRNDGVHFHNQGLDRAAQSWASSLDNGFFSNSQPLSPKPILGINLTCNKSGSNISYRLDVSGGFSNYRWNTGEGSNSINVSNGTFNVKVQDFAGNTFYSQPVNVSNNPQNNQPTISVNGSTTFCEGGTVQLSSNISGGNLWSNGERSQTIFARLGGNYTVQNFSLYGCASNSTNTVGVNVLPAPFNTISSDKSPIICPDDSVSLSTNNFNDVSYRWNTNATTSKIIVKKAGIYEITVKDNKNGCENRQTINVEIRERPKMTIFADTTTTFCFGGSVNLSPTGSNYSEYIWNTGAKNREINVKTNGNYSLKVKDQFGCLSDLATREVIVHPLPIAKIVATGLEKFCEGNSVKLSSSIQTAKYQWNSGQIDKEITVSKPDFFTLQVQDNNGCNSKIDTLQLKYIDPPAAIITGDGGLNTFCQGNTFTISSQPAAKYTWSTGQIDQKITINKAGIYTLKIKDENNCESKTTPFEVFTKEKPPIPNISIAGTYELEARSNPINPDFFYEWKYENELYKSVQNIVKASKRGDYLARSGIKYSLQNNNSLTCHSDYSTSFYYNLPTNDTGISLYPNPNPDGNFTIETREEITNATIRVFSLNGSLIYSDIIPDLKTKKPLNLTSLHGGSYFIRIISNDFSGSKKIIMK